MNPSKSIIFSHGFGVKADARGMFTDIAASLPDYESEMFDYNEILSNGDIVVPPLTEQSVILQRVLDDMKADGNILIAHSQGSIVAGLVDLEHVSQVILIAPPVTASMQHVIQKLSAKPGAELHLDGTSKLPRSDGTTTLIPKEYLISLDKIDPLSIYDVIASSVPTTIIRATNDNVLGLTNVNEVFKARLINIAADHDFAGEARKVLVKAIGEIVHG